jgi:hypothetical protein
MPCNPASVVAVRGSNSDRSLFADFVRQIRARSPDQLRGNTTPRLARSITRAGAMHQPGTGALTAAVLGLARVVEARAYPRVARARRYVFVSQHFRLQGDSNGVVDRLHLVTDADDQALR